MVILILLMFVAVILAAILDLQTSPFIDTSPILFFGGQNRQRKYVSGRISNDVFFIILFMFVAAILDISISPMEWHQPDSQYIGNVVSKTVITHWVDPNARSTPKSLFGCRTIANYVVRNLQLFYGQRKGK